MKRLIAWLFRRKVAPSEEEVRPNRAARRLSMRVKPGERQQKWLEGQIRRAKRKKARGYRRSHVRNREIYTAGVERGIDMTLRSLKNTIKGKAKRKWLPRITSRLAAA